MKKQLVVATAHGLVMMDREKDSWQQIGGSLTGQAFTSVASSHSYLLAGTREGLYRSADRGQTWWEANEGLSERHVRWLAFHPEEEALAYAGTEPAALFVTKDAGETWQECPEVTDLRDQKGWRLPYSPEAGCVRGFAFNGLRAYAAVEVGGLLRTDNRGETWHLAEGSTGDPHAHIPPDFIHPDVHSVAVHPSSPDQLFAPTGGGLYYSIDGGERWEHLYDCYCRAVWVDPARPGHIVLGPADSVDVRGRIEESLDGGETWVSIMMAGEDVWPNHMVERFVAMGDRLVAVLSNGEVIAAAISSLDWQWRSILPPVTDARAATVALK